MIPDIHFLPPQRGKLFFQPLQLKLEAIAGAALIQGVTENWSCSIGFFTQAPSPAFWKALKSICLALWYSTAACFASWQLLGLTVRMRRDDDSFGKRKTQPSSKARKRKYPGVNLEKMSSVILLIIQHYFGSIYLCFFITFVLRRSTSSNLD